MKAETEINLWRQDLTCLPGEIFDRASLEVLNVSENRLTSIPEADRQPDQAAYPAPAAGFM